MKEVNGIVINSKDTGLIFRETGELLYVLPVMESNEDLTGNALIIVLLARLLQDEDKEFIALLARKKDEYINNFVNIMQGNIYLN